MRLRGIIHGLALQFHKPQHRLRQFSGITLGRWTLFLLLLRP